MHEGTHSPSQWASKFGFILATAGAAIGLGNLWKFPYLMGKNGGFSFLMVYLLFIVILGLPVMITELSIGRMTQKNAADAYRSINKHTTFIGILGILSAFVILSYYSVIGGWILKYIASYVTTFRAPADFSAYIAKPLEPVVWHVVFMVCTMVICYRGTKGIEKASKVMMPALFVLLVVIIIRSLTLPGAVEGLKFIFTPKDSHLTLGGATAAMGQVFYSLSLGMGITVTYGSYLKKEEDIPRSCLHVAGLDTLAAVMAGLAIFPAVFALGMEPAQGPSLIFGTLPAVFGAMFGGSVFAILFFVLMFFAALTSAIALLECVVAYTEGSWKWSRKKSVFLVGLMIGLLGIPSSLSFGPMAEMKLLGYTFFDLMGVLTDNLLMPLSGLAMCIFVGWFWGPRHIIDHIESSGVSFRLQKAWLWCVRIVAPVMVVAVMIMGILNVYQFVTGG